MRCQLGSADSAIKRKANGGALRANHRPQHASPSSDAFTINLRAPALVVTGYLFGRKLRSNGKCPMGQIPLGKEKQLAPTGPERHGVRARQRRFSCITHCSFEKSAAPAVALHILAVVRRLRGAHSSSERPSGT